MKACEPMVVGIWTNLGNEVAHWKVLVPDLSVDQWYSSESEPPGPRRMRVPISLRSAMVCPLSKLVSQIAVLTPNQRESTGRRDCEALTARWTRAGAGLATSWISSR